MNLKSFGDSLWKRYLANGFQWPVVAACLVLAVMAVIDYYFRVDVLWRLTVLLSVVVTLLWRFKKLSQKISPPTEQELYYLACEVNNENTLSVEANSLALPRSLLLPWAWKLYAMMALIFVALLVFDPTRLAVNRVMLLRSEWPQWTTITSVSVSQLVVEGEAIRVQFNTQGRAPKMVNLIIDDEDVKGQEQTLSSMGSDLWVYEFFHAPGDLQIKIKAGDDETPFYKVKVLAFPRLVQSNIVYKEPLYLGGNEKIFEGLNAKIPEGSKVSCHFAFRNLFELTSPSDCVETTSGKWSLDLGQVTQDTTVAIKGRSHQEMPEVELFTFRLKTIYDKRPEIVDLKPSGLSFYLPDAKVRIQFNAKDDYGVSQVEIMSNEETLFRSQESQEVDFFVDLSDYNLSPGDVLQIFPLATDSKGQKSDEHRVRLQIVDESTFKSYLLEEHQHIHKQLESLISSMDRRIKRQETNSLFKDNIEKGRLRSDNDKTRILVESMQRYSERLQQVKDLEKIAQQNDKDKQYISSTVPVLLERLMSKEDPQLDSQKRVTEKLKEISVRMAEGQDMHLIIRLIDQIISKQDKVIKKIP